MISTYTTYQSRFEKVIIRLLNLICPNNSFEYIIYTAYFPYRIIIRFISKIERKCRKHILGWLTCSYTSYSIVDQPDCLYEAGRLSDLTTVVQCLPLRLQKSFAKTTIVNFRGSEVFIAPMKMREYYQNLTSRAPTEFSHLLLQLFRSWKCWVEKSAYTSIGERR